MQTRRHGNCDSNLIVNAATLTIRLQSHCHAYDGGDSLPGSDATDASVQINCPFWCCWSSGCLSAGLLQCRRRLGQRRRRLNARRGRRHWRGYANRAFEAEFVQQQGMTSQALVPLWHWAQVPRSLRLLAGHFDLIVIALE